MSDKDIKAETPEAVEAAEAAGQETQDLQLLLEDARAKADEHWNQLLRLRAEMDNVRRRGEREVANAHKYALERFVQELLPVRDSLELGLAATGGAERLREGMELTLKLLADAMAKFGVQTVDPIGQPFNPEQHQAMTLQESADQPPNTVLAVFQKGYMLNDRLVRPARVVVSKVPEAAPAEGGDRGPGSRIDERA